FMRRLWPLFLVLFAVIGLAACQSQPEATPTPSLPPTPTAAPQVTLITPTPQPTPEPRTLTICMGQEPQTLYPLAGETQAMRNILAAVYDGPIEYRTFGFQPVILEKLPNTADGDATMVEVDVAPGEWIVDAKGNLTTLKEGVSFFPSGCHSIRCALKYDPEMGSVSMDQLQVTFHLLPGLTWSDGQPLTAEDSVFTHNLVSAADTPAHGRYLDRLRHTAAYEAPNKTTVVWKAVPGYRDPTYYLNFWMPLPAHLWAKYEPKELLSLPEATRAPVGWGPYVIDEWKSGEYIRLHRNPHYFRSPEGLPKFDYLVFRFVSSPEQALEDLQSGACDVVDETVDLLSVSSQLDALAKEGKISAYYAEGTDFERLDMGIRPVSYDDGWQPGDRDDFFGDERVRQAFAYCLDRQKVVEEVWGGHATVMDSIVPAESALYNDKVTKYTYDPAKGAALLEAAGWVDNDGNPATPRVYQGEPAAITWGDPLVLRYWAPNTPREAQAAEIFKQSAAACGIELQVKLWDDPAQLYAPGPDGPIFGRKFDLAVVPMRMSVQPPCTLWTRDAIPGDGTLTVKDVPWLLKIFGKTHEDETAFPYGWAGWNDTAYVNTTFDGYCRAANDSLPDEEAYKTSVSQAQEILAADVPSLMLFRKPRIAATRADFCGFVLDPSAASDLWNLELFDDGPACR
ncbi:MAG: hypothetical protein GXO56_07010, partial [Chloroflexi bacterium]|nr:hypothetical protein [Chloroflexota bacterium]